MSSPISIIEEYFPNLSDEQRHQFGMLDELYRDWNAKINVISRKDIDSLYLHHILHSLGIAKVINFRPGSKIMDVGTGGGFPGIPLAILFPKCHFHLVDSIGKKIRVATEVATAIGLKNITLVHRNVMEEKEKFDFVVSRAVMDMRELVKLVRKNILPKGQNALPNGVICLKGGNLEEELRPFSRISDEWNLSDFFKEDFFETKKVIFVAC